ncbi:MAG: ABC transporter ATP-binding protein [Planctomycetes bacterium]|nr:ABC transporter ATP-binding protein [Planctomycetota bacterium]
MSQAPANSVLVNVRNLKKYFPVKKGLFGRTVAHVKAVDGVSFEIPPGRTLGLVGESGCGKTTVGRTVLRLIAPTSGEVMFDGRPVFDLKREELRALRRRMQIIFQDPYSSLNPRMTVEAIVGEALTVHGIAKGNERKIRVAELLEKVGLTARHLNRYPHEFSGGQRQRIGIARALALNPDFIVCDEAVSALDVSIQSQIINLLRKLQDELHLSYLFIAHDHAVVEHIRQEVAVMYLGQIVERANARALYATPLHPYTKSLLSVVPVPDPSKAKRERLILQGDVPSPLRPPSGCRFHTRCPIAYERCRESAPELQEEAPGHSTRCFFPHDPLPGQPGYEDARKKRIAEGEIPLGRG